MTFDRRLIAGALGLSLVLAACGGSGAAPAATAAPAEPAATDAATDAPAATVAPAATDAPAATEDGTDDGEPGGLRDDLASLLPERVGEVVYQRTGFDGDQLALFGAMAGIDGNELDPLLERHGKTLDDLTFALAASQGNTAAGMVYAMRIEGVQAAELMGGLSMESGEMTRATVAGKDVYTQGGGGIGIWVYPRDDILFVILLASDEIAQGILEQLP